MHKRKRNKVRKHPAIALAQKGRAERGSLKLDGLLAGCVDVALIDHQPSKDDSAIPRGDQTEDLTQTHTRSWPQR